MESFKGWYLLNWAIAFGPSSRTRSNSGYGACHRPWQLVSEICREDIED
ncbi:hypothetical protein [Neobacillus drentensis]|nr:hypothetical protein [Neobacillus drentensis]